MKIRPGIIFACLFIVLGLYTFVSEVSWRYFEAKLMPLIVSGSMFLLGLNQLRIELASEKKQGTSSDAETRPEAEDSEAPQSLKVTARSQWHRFLIILCWLGVAIVVVLLGGFIVATLVFTFLYLRTHELSWLRSSLVAVVLSAFFYGLFILVLRTQLYPGLLFSLFS